MFQNPVSTMMKTFNLYCASTITLKTSYHCAQCDKEFIDITLAAEHKKGTRHLIVERELEV